MKGQQSSVVNGYSVKVKTYQYQVSAYN